MSKVARKAAELGERPWPVKVEVGEKETLVEHLSKNAAKMALSTEQCRRLRHAFLLEQEGTRRQRRAAQALAVDILTELGGGIAETIRMELARGGQVQATKGGGVRLSARDGLIDLYDRGQLTGASAAEREGDKVGSISNWNRGAARMQAGLAYREFNEKLEEHLRCNLAQLGGVTGGGTNEVSAFTRAKASQLREKVDRAVMAGDPSGRQLRLLRQVAGEGRTVASVAPGGRNSKCAIAALIKALDVVDDVLKNPHAYRLTPVPE